MGSALVNSRDAWRSGAMQERIIETDADIAEGAAWLAAQDPRLRVALQRTGTLPLRRQQDGFEALLDAIISQQVSVASANALKKRLAEANLVAEDAIAAVGEASLREAGLSRQKARYVSALAEARLDYPALRHSALDEVVATLVALPGIGRWTAEIYAMFALGRADAFAAGDLALQESARLLFDIPRRPDEKELRRMAEDWQPWRAVAARLLWAWYRLEKGREGIRT